MFTAYNHAPWIYFVVAANSLLKMSTLVNLQPFPRTPNGIFNFQFSKFSLQLLQSFHRLQFSKWNFQTSFCSLPVQKSFPRTPNSNFHFQNSVCICYKVFTAYSFPKGNFKLHLQFNRSEVLSQNYKRQCPYSKFSFNIFLAHAI